MPRTRSRPDKVLNPAYSGRLVVDTFRGQVRIRKWPAKRGTPKSPAVREQNDWFRAVNTITKTCAPEQIAAAMRATAGTGVYPRDLLMHTISEGIGDMHMADGSIISHRRPGTQTVSFQGARLENISNIALSSGVLLTIPWQVPVFDTAGVWSIGNPAVMTVPAGVSIMNFGLALKTTHTGKYEQVGVLFSSVKGFFSRVDTGSGVDNGTYQESGPVPVTPGEQVVAGVVCNTNASLMGGIETNFTAYILQST